MMAITLLCIDDLRNRLTCDFYGSVKPVVELLATRCESLHLHVTLRSQFSLEFEICALEQMQVFVEFGKQLGFLDLDFVSLGHAVVDAIVPGLNVLVGLGESALVLSIAYLHTELAELVVKLNLHLVVGIHQRGLLALVFEQVLLGECVVLVNSLCLFSVEGV